MEALLKEFGLNQYEINAYLALLISEPVTGYKLGRLSGVPSGRIYDVLDSLTLKGLVEVELGRPKRFKAIDPNIALKSLITKKDREWQYTKDQMTDFISKLRKKELIEEQISVVKERDVYYHKVLDSYIKANKEVLVIAGELEATKRGIDILVESRKAVKRGVKVRMVVPLSKKNQELVKKIKRAGINIKNYPIKDLRLNLRDNKVGMIAFVDPSLSYNRATITIQSPIFCKAMKQLFETLWKEAKPINP